MMYIYAILRERPCGTCGRNKILKYMIELLLLGIAGSVNAHGMLFYAGPMPSPDTRGAIRDYDLVDHQIDSLRNPLLSPSVCRGASPRPPIMIQLSDKQDFQVTLALSIGAQHIGPCAVEILDADDLSKPGVLIASAPSGAGCAVQPIAQFNTDKASPASSQCPGKVPSGLVTDVRLYISLISGYVP